MPCHGASLQVHRAIRTHACAHGPSVLPRRGQRRLPKPSTFHSEPSSSTLHPQREPLNQVTDAGNGTYHVAYKAREGGEYALQVRVTCPA